MPEQSNKRKPRPRDVNQRAFQIAQEAKVIITFGLGFALAYAAGWYLSASSPHSGR